VIYPSLCYFFLDPFFLDLSFSSLLLPIYNADTDKQKILKENKDKSGIYMFKNLINGKKYVGSSENLKRRLAEYLNVASFALEQAQLFNAF
jgi:hypothetical protein